MNYNQQLAELTSSFLATHRDIEDAKTTAIGILSSCGVLPEENITNKWSNPETPPDVQALIICRNKKGHCIISKYLKCKYIHHISHVSLVDVVEWCYIYTADKELIYYTLNM